MKIQRFSFKLVMRKIDQQKAAWFESDLYANSALYIDTMLTVMTMSCENSAEGLLMCTYEKQS